MNEKIFRIVVVSLIIVVAFLIGFVTPEVGASRGSVTEFASQLQQLSSKLELGNDSEVELPVLQTYYDVLGRMRDSYFGPSGQKIDDRQMTYSAIRGMLASLSDPYTRFLDPDAYKQMREENQGNFVGIGAQLDVNKNEQVYIKEPLPDSPAIAAKVRAGDIILRVDGKSIAGLDIDDVVKRIRGEEGTKVTLTLVNGNEKPRNVVIIRKMVEFRMVRSKMLDEKNGIGYVRLYGFNEHSDDQMEEALNHLNKQKMKGLVLDLRQNPGGLLPVAVSIGSRFIDSGPVVIIEERSGKRNVLNVDPSRRGRKTLPLVVLVDKSSASASEIVSGAIQDNQSGTLVGSDTYGKARVQTVSPLTDGSAIAITTAKYLTPKGRDINKVGVKPDVYVASSEEAIELGDLAQDVQLKKAVSVLKDKMKGARSGVTAQGSGAKTKR